MSDVINLDAVDAATVGDFPPIPAGDYPVKVVDAKFETSKAGDPMYTFTLEVQDGEFKGRKVWHRRPIIAPRGDKKGTLGFVKADVKALGLHVPPSAAAALAKSIVKEGFGKLVIAKVGFGKGEYAEKNEVKGLLPLGAQSNDPQSLPPIREEDL